MTIDPEELAAGIAFIVFQVACALLFVGLSEPNSPPGQVLAFVTQGSF
jgi:hypothetical protein